MRVVGFPEEWGTAAPEDHLVRELPGDITIFGLLLRDGSNLYALIYPGGARFARAAPANGFAIEERFEGDPPGADSAVPEAWRALVEAMVQAGRAVAEEMKAEGLPVPARYRGDAS